MLKGQLTLLFLLLFSLASVAQHKKAQEYVIIQSNDTIYGEVKRELISGSVKVETDRRTLKFSEAEIKGIQEKSGKFFVHKDVITAEGASKDVLVQALVIGRASLFLYNDIFIVTKDDSLSLQVEREESLEYRGDKPVKKVTYTNMGKLAYLLSDCSLLPSVTSFRILSERNMTNLITEYNECISADYIEFKNTKEWTKVYFGISAGMDVSNLSFGSTQTVYLTLTEGEHNEVVTPTIMASFFLSSPRINDQISLRADLLYRKYKFESYYKAVIGGFLNQDYMSMTFQSVIIPITVQYSISKNWSIKPYISAGLSFQKNFNPEIIYIEEIERVGTNYTHEKTDPFTVKNQHIGYSAAFGFLKSFSPEIDGFIEVKGISSSNFHKETVYYTAEVTSNLSSISVLAGIRF